MSSVDQRLGEHDLVRGDGLPIPPTELIDRVGPVASFPDDVIAANPWLTDPVETYFRLGDSIRSQLLDALPSAWSLEGKRILDFGCGSGRVLRGFVGIPGTDLWGCDIDEKSIRWLGDNLSPPLQVLRCDESPPIDLPSHHFDLVYAISVFTHLTDNWAAWLRELHRLLKPDGLMVASFHGPGVAPALGRLPWHAPYDEDRIGMHVIGLGNTMGRGRSQRHPLPLVAAGPLGTTIHPVVAVTGSRRGARLLCRAPAAGDGDKGGPRTPRTWRTA